MIGVILTASAFVGAVTYVYFDAPHTGVYSGPGVPVYKSFSVTIGSNDSYYSLPVTMNYTGYYWINMTITSASVGNSGYNGEGQVSGVMNTTQYQNFTQNTSMTFLTSGDMSWSYYGHGKSNLFLIWLNELSVPSVYFNVNVELTLIQ